MNQEQVSIHDQARGSCRTVRDDGPWKEVGRKLQPVSEDDPVRDAICLSSPRRTPSYTAWRVSAVEITTSGHWSTFRTLVVRRLRPELTLPPIRSILSDIHRNNDRYTPPLERLSRIPVGDHQACVDLGTNLANCMTRSVSRPIRTSSAKRGRTEDHLAPSGDRRAAEKPHR